MGSVRAALLNAERELERRPLLGIDKKDECWDGEWHLANPPGRWHPRLNSDMFRALAAVGDRRGLSSYCGATGVFGDLEENWRAPDQVFARPDQEIDEGVTGAELVVEVRRPATTATRSSRSTPSGASPRC